MESVGPAPSNALELVYLTSVATSSIGRRELGWFCNIVAFERGQVILISFRPATLTQPITVASDRYAQL